MAAKVSVIIANGAGNVVECEVSGGAYHEAGNGTHDYTVGTQGAMVSFLTIKRLAAGDITIRSALGKLAVEIDGGKAKSVKSGSKIKLSSKNKQALVKEAVK